MKPTVAMVIDSWEYPFNGTVVSARRFVAAMTDEVEFRIMATPAPDGQPSQSMIPFNRLSIPGFNGLIDSMRVPLSSPRGVAAALDGADLLHVQFPFFLGFAAISEARRRGIPVISSFHVQPENILRNIGLPFRWLNAMLYRLFVSAIYNRSQLVIAPSEFAADLLRANGVTVPVHVVSNGVPQPFLDIGDSHKTDASQRPYRVLSVGRLAREKQHRVLLDAVAQSRFREDIALTIIGGGPLEDELRAYNAKLGLGATIASVSDAELMQAYSEADLFVHTGEIELEGMSVTEAMAAGNAVLVSDSPASAARTLVSDKNAVFACGNAADLANRIDYWLENSEARNTLAINNRVAAAHLSHHHSVTRMLDLYRELLPTRCNYPLADGG